MPLGAPPRASVARHTPSPAVLPAFLAAALSAASDRRHSVRAAGAGRAPVFAPVAALTAGGPARAVLLGSGAGPRAEVDAAHVDAVGGGRGADGGGRGAVGQAGRGGARVRVARDRCRPRVAPPAGVGRDGDEAALVGRQELRRVLRCRDARAV